MVMLDQAIKLSTDVGREARQNFFCISEIVVCGFTVSLKVTCQAWAAAYGANSVCELRSVMWGYNPQVPNVLHESIMRRVPVTYLQYLYSVHVDYN